MQPNYEFAWWMTQFPFPPDGVDQLLSKSIDWYKWVARGSLPRTEGDLPTSMLKPTDIDQVVAQLEEARDLLLDRIAHAEAEEADITEQIATWEDLVFKSASLDVLQQRINLMK